jgi:hypothetical protein
MNPVALAKTMDTFHTYTLSRHRNRTSSSSRFPTFIDFFSPAEVSPRIRDGLRSPDWPKPRLPYPSPQRRDHIPRPLPTPG